MRLLFADSAYWIALTNPRDYLHRAAIETTSGLDQYRIVTSELVLVEVLNYLSASGAHLRKAAADLVRELISDPSIELVPQTPELFRDALALYRDRLDKHWSLTDCASFLIMDRRQIVDALTYDEHFEQSGYRPLLRG